MLSHDERLPGALAERFAPTDWCVDLLCDGIGLPVAYGSGIATPLEQQRHLAEPAQEAAAPDDLLFRD